MHVGGLVLLKPPKGQSTIDYVHKVVADMRTYTQPVAPFSLRLKSRLGMWFWVEDDEFDLEAHFIHLSLPKPGRIRELLELTSSCMPRHWTAQSPCGKRMSSMVWKTVAWLCTPRCTMRWWMVWPA